MLKHFTLEHWIDEGQYVGRLKEVPDVIGQGKTIKELEKNIKKAYKLMVQCQRLPESKMSAKEIAIEVHNGINPIEILKKHEDTIKKKFGVKKIGVFGSSVREDAYERSDIDILVELRKSVDYFEFLDLQYYLEDLFNRKVDLVTPDALKPFIKERILKKVVYV